MENTEENDYLYSLTEILLRQKMIEMKERLGDIQSSTWVNVFIISGIKPPFLESDLLEELVDTYNNDSAEKLPELEVPDKFLLIFCLVIIQLLRTSDDDSLIAVDSENALDLLEALKPTKLSSPEEKEKYKLVKKEVFAAFGNAKNFLLLKNHITNHPDNLKNDIKDLLQSSLSPIAIELVWIIYCVLSIFSAVEQEILGILHESLKKGLIIAHGVEFPFGGKPELVKIEQIEWQYLEFHPLDDHDIVARYKNPEILGTKRTYAGLVFTVPRSSTKENITNRARAGRGRPSLMPLIAQQMQKRFDEGKLCKTLASEVRALEDWAIKEYTKSKTPIADSIAKSDEINALYYKLNPRKF